MDPLIILGGVFLTHAAVVVTPGPNFLVVSRAAVANSRAEAVWTALGITAAAAMWAAAAAIGFAAVLAAYAELYDALRLLGALYLLWIAISQWRSTSVGGVTVDGNSALSASAAFRRGLLTNLSNPKSLIYFGSILAAALPSDAPLSLRATAVAIITFDALIWYTAVALVLSRSSAQRRYLAARRLINRVAAGIMGLFAVRLLVGEP